MRVVGTAGPVVVLLPGGSDAAEGFAPRLVEGLVADPCCRVVLWDRPRGGRLTEAPTALHRMLGEHDLGPAVLVGQSLGGAVAAMTACAFPDDVAGLVLLDPTPVNDTVEALQIEGLATVAAIRGSRGLRRVVRGLARAAVAFDESRLPTVPAVVVAADRDAGERMHRAHVRLAARLDAPLLQWPGAEHGVHLSHPEQVLAAARDVVRRVG
ncbi:Alpha/beta hydrolase family protein [Nocardioides exalbidus]|uniref:Alpha/beta hydrolase family protein n=1 Tax=Nocardioides exalbidus TaxID=402596 RepID=A0A1H4WFB6_9ACTN|nr:alpha/beta hydrolase [Nocardioides exalbidus]SEC91965.1 Alpha/beta hydrolase family protein [Nocardioides exalbidus]